MVTADDVRRAASQLYPTVIRTPLLACDRLDAEVAARLVCKAENLQRTGSFKFRGAYYRLRRLPVAERARGVVAASSGNHAQALALAARMFGVPATVVMPADAPANKVAAARRHGARIVRYDRFRQDRDAIVADLAEHHGLVVVPSADAADVICGAGTVALEILTAAGELDAVVVPVGGGGLAAGCATVIKAMAPAVQVIGVEPAIANDTALSLRSGTRQTIAAPDTIADGLRHTTPAALPWTINQRLLDDIVTVTDHDIAAAVGLCFTWLKTVVEPSGAVALAAVAAGQVQPGYGRIAVVLSGGNADWATLHTLLGPDLT